MRLRGILALAGLMGGAVTGGGCTPAPPPSVHTFRLTFTDRIGPTPDMPVTPDCGSGCTVSPPSSTTDSQGSVTFSISWPGGTAAPGVGVSTDISDATGRGSWTRWPVPVADAGQLTPGGTTSVTRGEGEEWYGPISTPASPVPASKFFLACSEVGSTHGGLGWEVQAVSCDSGFFEAVDVNGASLGTGTPSGAGRVMPRASDGSVRVRFLRDVGPFRVGDLRVVPASVTTLEMWGGSHCTRTVGPAGVVRGCR